MKKCQNKSNLSVVADYLAGNRPFAQISMYIEDNKKHRNEGEMWKDKEGIEWQKKDGKTVRLTKTQGDIIRDAIGTRKCKCGLEIRWGNKFDLIFFAKTGMCQDCLIEYEHKLHAIGAFSLYEKYKLLSNEIGFFKDAKVKLEETINFFTNEDSTIEVLCNSEGFREKFHGTNKEQILKDAKVDYDAVAAHIKEITKYAKELKRDLKKKTSEFKVKLYV